MRIIILLCLFGIIFFACVCISFGYRLLNKLKDIQDDLAALEDLNNVATIENPEAIKRSVKSGLVITIISRLAAADEIQAGEVLEFPFSQDGSGRNLNLVYNKNYKLPAAAEHVRELIIEKYELQKQSLQ